MKKKNAKKGPPVGGFKLLMFFIRPLFKLLYSPKIIDAKNIPKQGAVVIAGNHKHAFDQFMTISATKRPINYMAKREYFDGKLEPLFRFVGCIPVNRNGTDFEAIKAGLCVLRRGGAIGIFPEGTRNRTSEFLLEFKAGAVALAKKTGAPIVPFGLSGDYKFRSKNLTIRFGKPFYVSDMTVEEAKERLFNEVKCLMEENIKEEKTASSEKNMA